MATSRLVYLVSQYPAINHTFILREIRELRGQGIDLHVLSISDPDRPSSKLTEVERQEEEQTYYIKRQGVPGALRVHAREFFRRPGRYLAALAYAWGLHGWNLGRTARHLLYFAEAVIVARKLEELRAERVHSHFTSTVALLTARIRPHSLSLTIHGPAEFQDPKGFLLPKKIEASRKVIAISYFAKSQLMIEVPPREWSKIHVVPLGVDTAQFQPDTARPSSSDAVEIVTVGRLAPVKGHHLLLQSVARLVSEGLRVTLRIIGDGSERESLQAAARSMNLDDRVVFMGARTQDEVLDCYRRADIFALPSFAEGVPVVLMEAMAMEIPCLATRTMGIPELIRDGIDGLLVSPANGDELTESLRRLVNDPELRRKLGRSGRSRVCEAYDLKKNCRRLAAVLFDQECSEAAG